MSVRDGLLVDLNNFLNCISIILDGLVDLEFPCLVELISFLSLRRRTWER